MSESEDGACEVKVVMACVAKVHDDCSKEPEEERQERSPQIGRGTTPLRFGPVDQIYEYESYPMNDDNNNKSIKQLYTQPPYRPVRPIEAPYYGYQEGAAKARHRALLLQNVVNNYYVFENLQTWQTTERVLLWHRNGCVEFKTPLKTPAENNQDYFLHFIDKKPDECELSPQEAERLYHVQNECSNFGVNQPKPDPELLQVKRVRPGAIVPKKGSSGSAGFDVSTVEDACIPPGEVKAIPIGWTVDIPQSSYARIAPRSGLALRNINVGGGAVDYDFNGEVVVIVQKNLCT